MSIQVLIIASFGLVSLFSACINGIRNEAIKEKEENN
jgi:hypothetical protein